MEARQFQILSSQGLEIRCTSHLCPAEGDTAQDAQLVRASVSDLQSPNPSVWAELSSVRKENTEVLSDFQTPIFLYESKI